MVLKKIKVSTIQDSVYESLFKSILAGWIEPGERITLEGLAKQLDVSVMPIRESIRRLEAEGFVSIHANRKIVVNELSAENLKQILEARLILEPYAAKKTCKNRSKESLEKLEKSLKKMRDTTNEEIYLRANKEFHMVIYQDASPIMLELISRLWEKVSPYLHILLREEKDWKKDNFEANHLGMLEGMSTKNPKITAKWLKKDLTDAAGLIIAMLERKKDTVVKRDLY